MITLTLANWLEQRPRMPEEYLYIRQKEFTRSKPYIPACVYEDFEIAYSIKA